MVSYVGVLSCVEYGIRRVVSASKGISDKTPSHPTRGVQQEFPTSISTRYLLLTYLYKSSNQPRIVPHLSPSTGQVYLFLAQNSQPLPCVDSTPRTNHNHNANINHNHNPNPGLRCAEVVRKKKTRQQKHFREKRRLYDTTIHAR